MIYLDWNATAPLREEALEAMLPYLREHFGNPSSTHQAGRKARVAVDAARDAVAALIGADPREIVFTSGATEANNLALVGVLARTPGRVLATQVEHPSVLEPLRALLQRGKIELEWVPMSPEGALEKVSVSPGTRLVTIMAANNETGRLFSIADWAAVAHQAGALMHSDLTQAAGRIGVDVHAWKVDLGALSSHKIGGPKGVGALYVRRGLELEKLLHGGRQERSRRPGTENVAGIVGFGAAAAAAKRELENYAVRIRALRQRLWTGLQTLTPQPVLNTPLAESVPNTLNVSFRGFDGVFLLQRLDLEGLCVSSGSACSSGVSEPSPVLVALGFDSERIRGAVRFSLGWNTTEADIDAAVALVKRAVTSLARVGR